MKRKILYVPIFLLVLGSLAACGSSEMPASTQLAPSPEIPTVTVLAPPAAQAPTATALTPADTPTPTTDAAIATTTPTEPATPTPEPPTPTATTTPTPTAVSVNLSTIALKSERLAGGFESPVFVTHAGDGSGRLFVVEKPGNVVALDADGRSLGDFLNIRDRVDSGGSEQGLLGLAFHPQFSSNGQLFVYYTDRDGDTVVSRFQANADRAVADPASEVVVLTAEQPAANHNGGMIAFGPDGLLYIGLGDGGRAGDPWGNAQNLDAVLGKVLRIDVDGGAPYAVPAGNPFVGRQDARPEIWAYGLRNPWRFSFDRSTGDLWIGDVGQGQWEEINVQLASSAGGENYGWDIMEGTRCYDADSCDRNGLALPVAEYEHGDNGCSVTGGYVYRGNAVPSLAGVYLYGDYCSGRIWGLANDAAGQMQNTLVLDTDLQISSFGETEDGDVLVVDLNGGVYRLGQK